MKAWITKYALTTGIYEVEFKQSEYQARHGSMSTNEMYPSYFSNGTWHSTKELAISKAYEMKIKKLQSLDKQMKKISALEFDV